MAEVKLGKWTEEELKKKFEGLVDSWKTCKVKDDFDKATCMFDVLHEITEIQDYIQLGIPNANTSIRHSTMLTNSANAIMLGISRSKGDLRKMLSDLYVEEKVKALTGFLGWNGMIHDYNLTRSDKDDLKPLLDCRNVIERDKVAPQDVQKYEKENLFKGFVK
ncbi:hypothetical protein LCGC14_1919990 [marine sediment metagenome]|uniref:Uncharacterized protein n=1 Tax=marine sediment metagenome TaxID=412755 RepID=A0A0F9INV1_9ZZZZ